MSQYETEKIGNSAIVRGSEDEIRSLRIMLKSYLGVDVHDSINIEFVENEEKDFVEKYRSLSYLKNCIDIPPIRIDDPKQYPELHEELSDKEYPIPPIDEFNKLEMNVTLPMASFLVEIFCPDQSETEKYCYEKQFFKKKTIYKLLIYASLPVSIEPVFAPNNQPQSCIIKFADTQIASAQVICDQIKFAIKIFYAKVCYAVFKNVDIDHFKKSYLDKISRELDCAFLKTPNYYVYENRGCFYMYVLPNQFGEEARNKIRLVLQDVFTTVQVFQCENCSKLVTNDNQERCVIQSLFDGPDDLMEFNNHKPSGSSPSEFQFNTVPLI